MQRHSFTFKLSPDQQVVLLEILKNGNYRPAVVPHTLAAAKGEDCIVNLYRSGKCLVQGAGAEDFVTFTLEPLVLQSAGVGYEDVLNPQGIAPHMGVDESGKGDFFGPLVVAAAFVDESLIKTMRDMKVRDSKTITSDDKAMTMGSDLRKLLGHRFAVVKIGPSAYNRLYAKIRNVNRLLAWAHARAIEDLLERVPSCPRAISDQFGSKEQVERALMKKGRQIELEQRHKAESDMAVAAASVIARDLFLRALKDMAGQYGTRLPKGASAAVRDIGVDLVKKHGPAVLLEAAKCHFKTTDAVLEQAGFKRSALGSEGQAVSKPMTNFPRRKRSEPR